MLQHIPQATSSVTPLAATQCWGCGQTPSLVPPCEAPRLPHSCSDRASGPKGRAPISATSPTSSVRLTWGPPERTVIWGAPHGTGVVDRSGQHPDSGCKGPELRLRPLPQCFRAPGEGPPSCVLRCLRGLGSTWVLILGRISGRYRLWSRDRQGLT